jgi:hypothetical protein
MVIVDVGRAVTNQDPLVLGHNTIIAPILLHTSLTFMMEDFLLVFIPFYLGAALFNERDTLRDLMKAFVVGGLVYLPLVVFELRASPQLHAWVYGYHQHSVAAGAARRCVSADGVHASRPGAGPVSGHQPRCSALGWPRHGKSCAA